MAIVKVALVLIALGACSLVYGTETTYKLFKAKSGDKILSGRSMAKMTATIISPSDQRSEEPITFPLGYMIRIRSTNTFFALLAVFKNEKVLTTHTGMALDDSLKLDEAEALFVNLYKNYKSSTLEQGILCYFGKQAQEMCFRA